MMAWESDDGGLAGPGPGCVVVRALCRTFDDERSGKVDDVARVFCLYNMMDTYLQRDDRVCSLPCSPLPNPQARSKFSPYTGELR